MQRRYSHNQKGLDVWVIERLLQKIISSLLVIIDFVKEAEKRVYRAGGEQADVRGRSGGSYRHGL